MSKTKVFITSILSFILLSIFICLTVVFTNQYRANILDGINKVVDNTMNSIATKSQIYKQLQAENEFVVRELADKSKELSDKQIELNNLLTNFLNLQIEKDNIQKLYDDVVSLLISEKLVIIDNVLYYFCNDDYVIYNELGFELTPNFVIDNVNYYDWVSILNANTGLYYLRYELEHFNPSTTYLGYNVVVVYFNDGNRFEVSRGYYVGFEEIPSTFSNISTDCVYYGPDNYCIYYFKMHKFISIFSSMQEQLDNTQLQLNDIMAQINNYGNAIESLQEQLTNIELLLNDYDCNFDMESQTIELLAYSDKSITSVIIPSSIVLNNKTYIVTQLNSTFKDCLNLVNVEIPNTIINVGQYSFQNCTSLANIIIPNSVEIIGNSAFYGCTSLTSITVPNSVVSIGSGVFRECSNLTSIHLNSNITVIPGLFVYNCFKLTSINLSTNITEIGNSAFSGCSLLAISINLPNIVKIGANSFEKTKITSFTLGPSITTIGNYAFDSKSVYKTIYIKATVPPVIYAKTLGETTTYITKIYVPTDSLTIYQTAPYFSGVSAKIYGMGF